jgi:hypothetical protein
MDILWWTDRDGNVIRQTLPGITLEICDADTALSTVKRTKSDQQKSIHQIADTIRKYAELLRNPVSSLMETDDH